MFRYEVTLNGCGLTLRARDTSCPCTRRTSFDFDDVALMTFQALRHVIKLCLRVLRQHRAATAERNFNVADRLVGVEAADRRVQRVNVTRCRHRSLVGL